MKVAIYTCVTNGYDTLSPPFVITHGVDYLCFNDGTITVPTPWEDIRIGETYSGREANRYVKILPHLNVRLAQYDMTIYVDGAIEIVGDLSALIEQTQSRSGSIFMYEHPRRNCVYLEARACVEGMKAPVSATLALIKTFRKEGMPEGLGLFEGGVIVRKKALELECLLRTWWENYITGVKRDQLALMYAMWITGVRIQSLGEPDHRINQRYFRCRAGHAGDFLRRHFAWWIWRPMISVLVDLKVIKL